MKDEKNNEAPVEEDSLAIEVKTFTSDSLGSLRTAYDQYGRPVVCLKDACAILGIVNPSDAKRRLKQDGVVRLVKTDGTKFNNYLYITEGNLYRLIFQSRKEEALAFTDWVTDVVIPSIRKYGRYDVRSITSSPEVALNFLDSFNELKIQNDILRNINDENEEIRKHTRDMLESGVLSYLYDAPAKLKIKGINKQTLFAILRTKGVLDENNVPVQEYIDKEWFRVDTHSYMNKNAVTVTHIVPMVYKTGINGIRKILNDMAGKKNL